MPTPDASQWNIGGVGSSGVGDVYFMCISCILVALFQSLCMIFCVGYAKISRRKGRFQWNMGFRFSLQRKSILEDGNHSLSDST